MGQELSWLCLPAQLPKLDGVLEAAQLRLAEVCEQELLPGREFAHDVGGQDLPSFRLVADARRQVDRRAEEIVILGDRFARVQPDVDAERRVGVLLLMRADATLDGDGSVECCRGCRERRHDAIAGVFDLVPAVGGERRADDLVVRAPDLLRGRVAELLVSVVDDSMSVKRMVYMSAPPPASSAEERSNSARTSAAEAGRSAFGLASSLMISRSRLGGRDGLRFVGDSGGTFTCWYMMALASLPANGGRPVTSS